MKFLSSVQAVYEGLFILTMIILVGMWAAVYFPTRWVYRKLSNIWIE